MSLTERSRGRGDFERGSSAMFYRVTIERRQRNVSSNTRVSTHAVSCLVLQLRIRDANTDFAVPHGLMGRFLKTRMGLAF